ncbi:hypothetical protein, partial [Streptomyces swartbergensis]|uniref:hypothetical protein n=1 Tax=Streptomyces swartbergensis TaxID=487165 RepID=UPI001ABFA21E
MARAEAALRSEVGLVAAVVAWDLPGRAGGPTVNRAGIARPYGPQGRHSGADRTLRGPGRQQTGPGSPLT